MGWLLFIYNTCFLSAQILGVAIRFGKFSVKENKQLEKNVQEFLSLTGIETADKLLHTDRYPEEKAAITDLKRRFAFRLHIGEWRALRPVAAKGIRRRATAAGIRHSAGVSAAAAPGGLTRSLCFGALGVCSCLPRIVLYRFYEEISDRFLAFTR